MRCFVVVALLVAQSCYLLARTFKNPFTSYELERLANVRFSELPHHIQLSLLKTKKTDGDDSHFCCATNTTMPIGVRAVTKTSQKSVLVGSVVGGGSHSCGFILLSRCSNQKHMVYRYKTVYYTESQLVPDYAQCAEGHIACCRHFIMISHQCFELEKVAGNVDFFKAVANGTFGDGIFG